MFLYHAGPVHRSSHHCARLFVLGGTFAVSQAGWEENGNEPRAKEDAEQTWTAEGSNGGC